MKHHNLQFKRAAGVDYIECGLIELKFDGGGDAVTGMRFQGYGAVFGNVDQGGDLIEPGAFAMFLADLKAGRQPWPAMLSQHGGLQLTAQDITPVGAWHDLAEDGRGLKADGELCDTPRGEELYKLMKMKPRPAIDGLSIGYIAKEAEPRSKPEDPRRRLKRIDLVEISPVTFPMNRMARGEVGDHETHCRASPTGRGPLAVRSQGRAGRRLQSPAAGSTGR